jgi:hypothetical protein
MATDHVDPPSQLSFVFEQQIHVSSQTRSRAHLALVISNEPSVDEERKVQKYLQVFEAAIERVKLF